MKREQLEKLIKNAFIMAREGAASFDPTYDNVAVMAGPVSAVLLHHALEDDGAGRETGVRGVLLEDKTPGTRSSKIVRTGIGGAPCRDPL